MTFVTVLWALVFGLIGYLSGSLPFSVWITRLFKGVDVRDSGSGHATTTNTIRQAGFVPGALVFLLDVTKGFLPVWLALRYAPAPWIIPLTAGMTVIGHCWPLFAGFRGGMGLAPACGAVLAIQPLASVVILALLVIMTLILRHGARATIVAALLIVPVLLLLGFRGMVIWTVVVVASVIAYRFLIDWNRKYRELWLDREKPE